MSGVEVTQAEAKDWGDLHRIQHDGVPLVKPKLGGHIIRWAVDEIAASRAATADLVRERDALREALEKLRGWGQHDEGCDKDYEYGRGAEGICDCGLEAAEEAARRALAGGER